MNKHKKLSAKLFLTLVIGISLVIIAALYMEFRLSKKYINYQAQSLTANSIRFRTNTIKEELETFKRLSQNVAVLVSAVNMDRLQIEQLHQLTFRLSEEIHGIGIFISDADEKSSEYNRYYYKEYDSVKMLKSLPYTHNELIPGLPSNGPTSIQNNAGETLLVFYTQINSQAGNSKLLLTVDFSPAFIINNLEKVASLYDTKYLILDDSKRILFHNYKIPFKSEELQLFWDKKIQSKYLGSFEVGNNSTEIFIPSKDYNRKESVLILPMANIGWNCFFFVSDTKLDQTLVRHFLLISLLSILAIIVTGLIISYYSRKITGPLSLISRAVKSLENGNLYSDLPEIDTADELEDIAKSFQKVQTKMQHYATGFKNSLEEKRAMAHDLRMANKIQESMLPDQFQGLTDFPEINIFTRLVPAKGVAGDFFDHCFLPGNRFFFIVGDVSGKGMPAALYMVKVLTLLRTKNIRSIPLHQMFTEISNALNSINDGGTFVTAIGGVLNYKNGKLILCDAGHNPPFMSKGGQAFGNIELNKNVPLGVVADCTYKESKFQLKKEDALFLYTDGLPEAVDTNGNMFEQERIIQSLAGHQNKKLEVIFNHLKNNLLNFVGKAKQADDITVFFLRYMK
jgi:phosphoserine phosphatase RsbU/P